MAANTSSSGSSARMAKTHPTSIRCFMILVILAVIQVLRTSGCSLGGDATHGEDSPPKGHHARHRHVQREALCPVGQTVDGISGNSTALCEISTGLSSMEKYTKEVEAELLKRLVGLRSASSNDGKARNFTAMPGLDSIIGQTDGQQEETDMGASGERKEHVFKVETSFIFARKEDRGMYFELKALTSASLDKAVLRVYVRRLHNQAAKAQVHMHLYLLDDTISIEELTLTGAIPANATGHWVEFQVTKTFRAWLDLPSQKGTLRIEVVADADDGRNNAVLNDDFDDEHDKVPYFEITQKELDRERRSRSGDCRVGVDAILCCRQRIHVDLTKLPSLKFVLSPSRFDAFVCSGSCAMPVPQIKGVESYSRQRRHQHGKSNEQTRACTASSSGDLHVVYQTKNNDVLSGSLPGMVILSCACGPN